MSRLDEITKLLNDNQPAVVPIPAARSSVLRPPSKAEIAVYNGVVPLLSVLVGVGYGGLAGFSLYGLFFASSFTVNKLGVLSMMPRLLAKKKEIEMRYAGVTCRDFLGRDIPYLTMGILTVGLAATALISNIPLSEDGADGFFNEVGASRPLSVAENILKYALLGAFLIGYVLPSAILGVSSLLMRAYRLFGMPGQPEHALCWKIRQDLERLPYPTKKDFHYATMDFFKMLYDESQLRDEDFRNRIKPQASVLSVENMLTGLLVLANVGEMPLWLNLAARGAGYSLSLNFLSALPRLFFYMDTTSNTWARLQSMMQKGMNAIGVSVVALLLFTIACGVGSSKGMYLEANGFAAQNSTAPYRAWLPEYIQPETYYAYYFGFFAGLVNTLFAWGILNDVFGLMNDFQVSFLKAFVEKLFPHIYKIQEEESAEGIHKKDIKLALENGAPAVQLWERKPIEVVDNQGGLTQVASTQSLTQQNSADEILVSPKAQSSSERSIDFEQVGRLRTAFWKAYKDHDSSDTQSVSSEASMATRVGEGYQRIN